MEQVKINKGRLNVNLERSPFATRIDVLFDTNVKTFRLAVLQKKLLLV